jgi:hypothetical protein
MNDLPSDPALSLRHKLGTRADRIRDLNHGNSCQQCMLSHILTAAERSFTASGPRPCEAAP